MISFIIGGAGSGKSEFAEKLSIKYKKGKELFYIATMIPNPQDLECEAKITRHHHLRAGKGFETIECYTDIKKINICKDSTVLLECISNLVANEMFCDDGAGIHAYESIKNGLNFLNEISSNLIIVSNNVFGDGRNYDEMTDRYMKLLSDVNIYIADIADEVIEVVDSIPIYIKTNMES